jgi:transposase-like protein
MTTGDIQAHLAEIYDTDISRDTISRITDAIVEDLIAWQNRPLDRGRFLSVVANYVV